MKQSLKHLSTLFEQDLATCPHQEHPRPQFKRENYIFLNGWWDFFVQSKNGKKSEQTKILVPFCPESRISGVFKEINKGDFMVYSRSFTIDKEFNKGKVVLHVDECDQSLKVMLNGNLVGEGEGVLPHEFDITAFLQEENHLEIIAKDDLDREIPYGKQRKNAVVCGTQKPAE